MFVNFWQLQHREKFSNIIQFVRSFVRSFIHSYICSNWNFIHANIIDINIFDISDDDDFILEKKAKKKIMMIIMNQESKQAKNKKCFNVSHMFCHKVFYRILAGLFIWIVNASIMWWWVVNKKIFDNLIEWLSSNGQFGWFSFRSASSIKTLSNSVCVRLNVMQSKSKRKSFNNVIVFLNVM